MDKTNDIVEKIVNGIIANNRLTEKERFKEIVEIAKPLTIKNALHFHFQFSRPYERFLRVLVESEIPTRSNLPNLLTFLFLNYRFVENNLTRLFVKQEGLTCSVDKANTIIDYITDWYSNEKERDLPNQMVFKSHDQIIDYYNSLISLFYGNPDKYIENYNLLTNN